MLCQPWTFGNYPLHIANNMDYTVTPNNGKMVLKQGCTLISRGRSTDRGVSRGSRYGADGSGTAQWVIK